VHELGLCEDILGAVERRAAGRRVTGVRVRVGAAHRVSEAALAQAFELVAAGTVAAGATVDVVPLPMHVTCRSCGSQASSQDALARCSACGGIDLDMRDGDELVLESIQVATSESPPERSADVSRHRG